MISTITASGSAKEKHQNQEDEGRTICTVFLDNVPSVAGICFCLLSCRNAKNLLNLLDVHDSVCSCCFILIVVRDVLFTFQIVKCCYVSVVMFLEFLLKTDYLSTALTFFSLQIQMNSPTLVVLYYPPISTLLSSNLLGKNHFHNPAVAFSVVKPKVVQALH